MELEILRWIQTVAHPFWDGFFQLVTMLGEPYLPVLLISVLYWVLDRDSGECLCFALLTSLLFNNVVKNIFRLPRPIGEEGIRSLRVETATGWSFPSGHTQTAATLGFAAGARFGRPWVRWAALGFSLLVGFSRLYLGVHSPKDVVFGLVFGAVFALLCCFLFQKVRRRLLMYGIVALAALPFVLLRGDGDLYDIYGVFCGFFAGVALERHFAWLTPPPASLCRRLLRWGVGLTALVLVLLPLLLLPDHPFLHALRYGLIGFTAIGICPWVFQKLKV
ncbi:MAG: phosphatase PAP2 family protein [Oscillospiraceae bacterium]|nr:phosphatase PAP2 family protein [Oscillospiraceae bacterium]